MYIFTSQETGLCGVFISAVFSSSVDKDKREVA